VACIISAIWNQTKKLEKRKTKKYKKDMLRSVGKQSVESVLEKKRKAAVGRIFRKGRF